MTKPIIHRKSYKNNEEYDYGKHKLFVFYNKNQSIIKMVLKHLVDESNNFFITFKLMGYIDTMNNPYYFPILLSERAFSLHLNKKMKFFTINKQCSYTEEEAMAIYKNIVGRLIKSNGV